MATLLLLPGYGGKYTSPVFGTSSTTADSDTFDCSRCAHIAVQVVHDLSYAAEDPGSSSSDSDSLGAVEIPAGSVQLQQTLDGENWADFGNAIDVATEGTIARYGITDGPFGRLRIDPADISEGQVHFIVVGWPLAEVN